MPLNKYFIIYKPYGMISQFSADGDKPTLAKLYDFPADVYPVGRLDTDSEGLLILTNDKSLNQKLLHPSNKHARTYHAQVEGCVNSQALETLSKGTKITIDGSSYQTLPTIVTLLESEPELPERVPSVRYRKTIPTSWIKLILYEGKNRQVRKMTASVGFPTLRLVRTHIESLSAEGMYAGEVREIKKHKLFEQLFNTHYN